MEPITDEYDLATNMNIIPNAPSTEDGQWGSHNMNNTRQSSLSATNGLRHRYVQHHYSDCSHLTAIDVKSILSRCPKSRKSCKFGEVLHRILDETDPGIIRWQPHGRSVLIVDPKRLTQTVLPHYFKQSKLTSFQRQFNVYGFERITQGLDAGSYYNELFLRGKPYLCPLMQRTRVKGTRCKGRSMPEEEPNFQMYEPMPHTGASCGSLRDSYGRGVEAPTPDPYAKAVGLYDDCANNQSGIFEDFYRQKPNCVDNQYIRTGNDPVGQSSSIMDNIAASEKQLRRILSRANNQPENIGAYKGRQDSCSQQTYNEKASSNHDTSLPWDLLSYLMDPASDPTSPSPSTKQASTDCHFANEQQPLNSKGDEEVKTKRRNFQRRNALRINSNVECCDVVEEQPTDITGTKRKREDIPTEKKEINTPQRRDSLVKMWRRLSETSLGGGFRRLSDAGLGDSIKFAPDNKTSDRRNSLTSFMKCISDIAKESSNQSASCYGGNTGGPNAIWPLSSTTIHKQDRQTTGTPPTIRGKFLRRSSTSLSQLF